MMKLIKTETYEPLGLEIGQESHVSSHDKIANALKNENCLGFYAWDGAPIGFALLRRFDEKGFFLWNFLIDCRHQGRGKGKEFLRLLIDKMKAEYGAEVITTTYIYGNDKAKGLYESFGFIQTDVVCEGDVHEVNMRLTPPMGCSLEAEGARRGLEI